MLSAFAKLATTDIKVSVHPEGVLVTLIIGVFPLYVIHVLPMYSVICVSEQPLAHFAAARFVAKKLPDHVAECVGDMCAAQIPELVNQAGIRFEHDFFKVFDQLLAVGVDLQSNFT